MTDLLDGVRARAALITRTALTTGWSVRVASGAQLTLVSVLRGRAWVLVGGQSLAIEPGEVALVRGPDSYTVAEDPSTPPDRVITRDDYCERTRDATRNTRTCGDPDRDPVLLLSGAYEGRAGISERLLDALPTALVVRDTDCQYPLLDHIADEAARGRPGQQVVLDRLLDLALISTLRAWFDRPGSDVPAWYRPPADPVVAAALHLLHHNPAHPWTVAELAARSGVSRAALARRFATEVGQPPMSYLAGWRTALAAEQLRETDATVGSIARKVGYANAFALSVAFKRTRGITPTQHRATLRGPTD